MFEQNRRQKKHAQYPSSFLDTIAIREGVLFKQAGTARGKWQSRYLVLRRGYLDYYADQAAWIEKKPKGVLALLEGKAELISETESGKPFTIAFSHASSKRVYLFMAMNREDQLAWHDAIRIEIAKTRKRVNALSFDLTSCEKEGYLLTQAQKQAKWDTKYIVIRGGVLEYYEEQSNWHNRHQPKQTVVLFAGQVVRVHESEAGKPYAWNLILSAERVYHFASFGPEEQTDWVFAVELEINHSLQRAKKDEADANLHGISEQHLKTQLESLQQTITELSEGLASKTDDKQRELCEQSIEEVREELNVLLALQRDLDSDTLSLPLDKQKKDSTASEAAFATRKDIINVLTGLCKQVAKLPDPNDEESHREGVDLLELFVHVLDGAKKEKDKTVLSTFLEQRTRSKPASPRLSAPLATPARNSNSGSSAAAPPMGKSSSRYGTLSTDSRGWFASKLANANPARALRETLRTRLEKKDDTKTLRPKLQTFEVDMTQMKLGAVLGSGATGVVYAGTYYDQPVAIKKLHAHIATEPDVIEAFVQEAEIWKPLTFRSILQLYGVCLEPGNICLVMEVGTMSLADLLYKKAIYPELSWVRRVTIAKEVAAACLYMHSKGIVHRDIKSMNILLTADYATKICDFGMARLLEDLEPSQEVASPERVAPAEVITGTPQWLAPEIGEGEVYTRAADVFSFGVVMWEIATRQLPYANENLINPSLFMAQIAKGLRPPLDAVQPAPNPEVSDLFVALAIKCWAPVPSQRPAFDVILAELSDILDLETKRDRAKEREAEVSLERGKEAFEKKEYEAAQSLLQHSLACTVSPEAYVNLWLCFVTCNQFDEALATCTTWIKDFPTSMAAYLKRGDTYMFLKRFNEALTAYTTAQSFDPYNASLATKIKAAKKNIALALDLSTTAIVAKKITQRTNMPPPPKRAPPPRPTSPQSTVILTTATDLPSPPGKRSGFDVLSSPMSPRGKSPGTQRTENSRYRRSSSVSSSPSSVKIDETSAEAPSLKTPRRDSLKPPTPPPTRVPPPKNNKPAPLVTEGPGFS